MIQEDIEIHIETILRQLPLNSKCSKEYCRIAFKEIEDQNSLNSLWSRLSKDQRETLLTKIYKEGDDDYIQSALIEFNATIKRTGNPIRDIYSFLKILVYKKDPLYDKLFGKMILRSEDFFEKSDFCLSPEFLDKQYLDNQSSLEEATRILMNDNYQQSSKYCILSLVANPGSGKTRFCLELKNAMLANRAGAYPIFISYNNETRATSEDKAEAKLGKMQCFWSRVTFDLLFRNSFLNHNNSLRTLTKLLSYLFLVPNMENLTEFIKEEVDSNIGRIAILVDELIQLQLDEESMLKFTSSIAGLASLKNHVLFTSLQLTRCFSLLTEMSQSGRPVKWINLNYISSIWGALEKTSNTDITKNLIYLTSSGHPRSIETINNQIEKVNQNFNLDIRFNTLDGSDEDWLLNFRLLMPLMFKENFSRSNSTLLQLYSNGRIHGVLNQSSVTKVCVPLIMLYNELANLEKEKEYLIFMKLMSILLHGITTSEELVYSTKPFYFETLSCLLIALFIQSNKFQNSKEASLISDEDGALFKIKEKKIRNPLNVTIDDDFLYDSVAPADLANNSKLGMFLVSQNNNKGFDSLIKTTKENIYVEFKCDSNGILQQKSLKSLLIDIKAKVEMLSLNPSKESIFLFYTLKKISLPCIQFSVSKFPLLKIYLVSHEEISSAYFTPTLKIFFQFFKYEVHNQKKAKTYNTNRLKVEDNVINIDQSLSELRKKTKYQLQRRPGKLLGAKRRK